MSPGSAASPAAPEPANPLLLIPGPTFVHPEVAAAAARPMIGHRGREIRALLGRVLPRVAALLGTEASVFPLGCSATGAMEAAVRNAAPGPFLHLVCGAFGQRWSEIRQRCGLEGDRVESDWGEPILAETVEAALARRRYGAVTLVHSETSTGIMNPLPEIAAVVRRHPDVLLLVDAVSSMSAVELRLDEWGVDVCFAGSQKAWALPPGLTLCAVSGRALRRSEVAPGRGFYLDWGEHERSLRKGQTPTTPPISLIFQLDAQLERIEREGLPARYARHLELQRRTLAWAEGRFVPFAREGYRSVTLTALRGGGRDLDGLLAAMRRRGFVLGSGYGKTRGDVLRIGHMGELQPEQLEGALAALSGLLDAAGARPKGKRA